MPMISNRLIPWSVLLFTVCYLTVATFFAMQSGNVEFIYYIGVVVILAFAAAAVHARINF